MTERQARRILGDHICYCPYTRGTSKTPIGEGLTTNKCTNNYLYVTDKNKVVMRGGFTSSELKAVAWWLDNHMEGNIPKEYEE